MACYTGKKCQNGKNFFPPRTVISVAWWWAKKKLHFVHSSQSYGGSKFNVPKNCAKSTHFEADLELGSRFGPERGQKRSKSQIFFFPRTVTSLAWWWAQKNLDFGHSSQSYKPLKFRQKVALCGGFCQMSTQWVIFFWHFSLLVPASLRSAGNHCHSVHNSITPLGYVWNIAFDCIKSYIWLTIVCHNS